MARQDSVTQRAERGAGGSIRVRWLAAATVVLLLLGACAVWMFQRDGVLHPSGAGPASAPPPGGTARVVDGPDPAGTASSAKDALPPGHVAARGLVRHAGTLAALRGVRVELYDESHGTGVLEREPLAHATSDGDGIYVLSADFYRVDSPALVFRKPGFVTAAHEFSIRDVQRELPAVSLAPGIRVTGEAVTAEGVPAGGGIVYGFDRLEAKLNFGRPDRSAPVKYAEAERGYRSTAPVDASGRFGIDLDPGLAAVEVAIPGFAPAFSEPILLVASGQHHIRVVVLPGATLTGVVRDAADGTPLADATVVVRAAVPDRGSDAAFEEYASRYRGESGADGTFAIHGLPDAIRGVSVFRDGYVPFHDPLRRRRTAGPPEEISLERGQWLTGRIVIGGRPPPAAMTCWLLVSSSGADADVFVTDREGGFRTGVLPAHYASGTWVPANGLPRDIEWDSGVGAHDLGSLEFDAGQSLDVRAVDTEGRPLAGVEVTCLLSAANSFSGVMEARLPSGVTGADGSTTITGLSPEDYTVLGRRSGFAPARSDVRVSHGDAPARITLALEADSRLLARIVDSAGNAVAGAHAAIRRDRGKPEEESRELAKFAVSDPEGRVGFEGPPPGRSFALEVTHVEFPNLVLPVGPLHAGETRDLGAIALSSAWSIGGRVVDESGAPVADAVVGLRGGGIARVERCDAAGVFRIRGLGNGTFALVSRTARHPWSDRREVEVRGAHVEGVELTLRQVATFEGLVLASDGSALAGAEVSLSGLLETQLAFAWPRTIVTDESGRFCILEPPQDALRLEVTDPRGLFCPELTVEADTLEELPATLVLPARGRLELVVRWPEGQAPASSVWATIESEASQDIEETRVRLQNGRGAVDAIGDGAYHIRLFSELLGPSESRPFEIRGASTAEVVLGFPADPPRLTVRVEDRSGTPLADASVSIRFEQGVLPISRLTARPLPIGSRAWGNTWIEYDGSTNGSGVFEVFRTDSQRVDVEARAHGYARRTLEAELAAGPECTLAVSLDPESVLFVETVDETGQPLDDIEVRIESVDSEGRSERLHLDPSRTKDGVLRIGALAAGRYRVSLRERSEALGVLEATVGTGEERTIRFERLPACYVTGRITLNGIPAEGGRVDFSSQETSKTAIIATDGSFAVSLARAGFYDIDYETPHGTQFPDGDARVENGSHLALDWEAASLSGIVRRSTGEPVGNASCRLEGFAPIRFRTDQDGRFRLSPIPAGGYMLRHDPQSNEFFDRGREIDVSGSMEVEHTVEATALLEIRFTQNREKASVSVSCLSAEGRHEIEAACSDDDDRTGRALVRWPQGTSWGCIESTRGGCAYFEVDPGLQRIDVALVPADHIRVAVISHAGEAIPDARVTIECADDVGNGFPVIALVTDRTGAAYVSLPAGAYTAAADLPSGERLASEFTAIPGAGTGILLRANER